MNNNSPTQTGNSFITLDRLRAQALSAQDPFQVRIISARKSYSWYANYEQVGQVFTVKLYVGGLSEPGGAYEVVGGNWNGFMIDAHEATILSEEIV